MEKVDLDVFGISIESHDGVSVITSDLTKEVDDDFELASMNAIESFILAIHCTGIDITTTQFKEAIETAVEGIWNNML
jgi:hypothetical protein